MSCQLLALQDCFHIGCCECKSGAPTNHSVLFILVGWFRPWQLHRLLLLDFGILRWASASQTSFQCRCILLHGLP